MFGCFICNTFTFETAHTLIDHLKHLHGVPSIYNYKCIQTCCCQQFQNIYKFKIHLSKHEKDTEEKRCSLNILKIDKSQSKDNLQQENQSSVCPINIETSDLCNKAYTSNVYNNVESNIKRSFVAFLLQLHSKKNLTRKNILDIQDSIKFTITTPMSEYIHSDVIPFIHNDLVLKKVKYLSETLQNPFKGIDTEYKFFKVITDIGIYQHPKSFTISNSVSEIIVNNSPTIESRLVEGCILDLHFQFKKYFETGNNFELTIQNMQRLQNCNKLSNFINGFLWKKKTQCQISNNIIIPLCGIYSCFPTIPAFQLSKLSNILVLGFLKSCDIREFGNMRCFTKFTDDINKLQREGITLNINNKKKSTCLFPTWFNSWR
nr:uncharacterized protein LOC111416710 isoform X2 [Onthophagus taurus]